MVRGRADRAPVTPRTPSGGHPAPLAIVFTAG
jgi:hypothetical protein